MGYSPRTYGGPESGRQWTETIDGKTFEYYTVIKDPGDGGPLGLSGNLAGDVLVYRKNTTLGLDLGQSDDILVGEIAATGPNKGKLRNESPILLPHLKKELEHFNEPTNLKRVKNQAKITIKDGMLATTDVNGDPIEPVADSVDEADKMADDLLDEGTTIEENQEKDPDDDQTSKPIEVKDNANSDFGIESGNMFYPIDVASTTQDVIKIQQLKYAPRKITTSAGLGLAPRAEQSSRKIGGTVFLSIPGGISDTNAVSYIDGQASPLQLLGAGVFQGILDKESASKMGEDISKALGTGSGNIATEVVSGLSAGVTGLNKEQILARTQGAITNNNLELLFESPQLREFQFVFLFSPRSGSEAATVKKIIRYFKQGMAVKQAGTNYFLKSPNTFQLTYMHRGERGEIHSGLNRFKETALTTMSVDYTPNQNYATYYDGTPVAYQVTMTFKELVPIYNEDYGQLDADATTIPLATQGGEGGIGF
tara:strand:+ start:7208 stop:8650 length:1443 start_codon:yes stop_codon:yes gene_type:complete